MTYQNISDLLFLKRLSALTLSACINDNEIDATIRRLSEMFAWRFMDTSTKVYCNALRIFSDYLGTMASERRVELR